MFQNPKKEFTVNFSVEQVKQAVSSLFEKEPNDYKLVKDDQILNEIRIHRPGSLLDPGYHIDFTFNKLDDNQTKVNIEVSRNLSSINTASEDQIANTIIKNAASKFSSYLSGDVDESGKAKTPQQGCMLVFLLLILSIFSLSFILL